MPKTKSIGISRDEWIAILSIAVIALILIFSLPAVMSSDWFTNLIPPLQYIIFNIGFILLTVVIFGIPVSLALHQKIDFAALFKGGISSWLIFTFIFDLWQPPFAFSPSGALLIQNSTSLIGSSVDYMLGWTIMQFFSVQNVIITLPVLGHISLLFILVYFITPIISVLIAALILEPKKLINLLK